jgi:imidazoleglycerol-phosphate dehydratase / histidinol-phosphatase
MKKKVLFIDRDGTIIREPKDYQIDSFDKLDFLPDVLTYLSKIAKTTEYELVMVTNQDGLGTSSFPERDFWPIQNLMLRILASQGIVFQNIFIDRSTAENPSNGRKPRTGMLINYIDSDKYDLQNSFVIGDRWTDVALAKNLGAHAIYINENENLGTDEVQSIDELNDVIKLKSKHWSEIFEYITLSERYVSHQRTTKETDVKIGINLDGTGVSNINTGLKFFDHMLDQIAKHGQIDLEIKVQGDLEVDEHHTIEDTAITLGEAFAKALGDKRGIERYGFCLPMDDCLAQVAIDFGGRAWLMWQAPFRREKIGDMPTEMFFHFFKSFADGAKANLNIKADGFNEHHKIEAIFKALAKAIKAAVKRDAEKMILPTTKGMI